LSARSPAFKAPPIIPGVSAISAPQAAVTLFRFFPPRGIESLIPRNTPSSRLPGDPDVRSRKSREPRHINIREDEVEV